MFTTTTTNNHHYLKINKITLHSPKYLEKVLLKLKKKKRSRIRWKCMELHGKITY